MKFDEYANAIASAKSARRLNNLSLQIIQEKKLLAMEIFHLGRLNGMRHCMINRKKSNQPNP